jgi:hypothetical protein
VDVVGHHLQAVDGHAQLTSLLPEQAAEAIGDSLDQDRSPILGTPDDVILQGEDRAGVLSITTLHATDYTDGVELMNVCCFLSTTEGGDSPIA